MRLGWIDRLLTLLFHAGLEALAQPTVAALVAFVLVDDAVARKATRVHVVFAHAAPKEALATVAAGGAVVFAGGAIAAYRAGGQGVRIVQQLGGTDVGRCASCAGCGRCGRRRIGRMRHAGGESVRCGAGSILELNVVFCARG